jgi:hypothetical protein
VGADVVIDLLVVWHRWRLSTGDRVDHLLDDAVFSVVHRCACTVSRIPMKPSPTAITSKPAKTCA